MLQPAVLVPSCLLLCLGSSASLFSHGDSSSDEDLQLPAVFPVVGVASRQTPPTWPKAPSGIMVEVEDTKTNIWLSFAIFIVPEEEKDGTDGRGSESDEETKKQEIQSLLPTETDSSSQPMKKELSNHMTDEERLSSEEMLGVQSMFVSSDEEADHVNNTVHLHKSLSDDSDDFNNSTESTEINSQSTRTIFDYLDDRNTSSDDPKLSLSHGLGNSLSSEAAELSRNLQGITLNTDNPGHSSSQLVLDRVLQEVLSSSSEESSSANQDRISSSCQTGFSLSSDDTDESSETFGQVTFDQINHTGVSSGPGSDESLESPARHRV